ncbi:precorrin-6y C5,15-methyltransferase (decarboxylating) subunit CbiE [Nocardia panacis]|uniref:Precorrin-6y C5,15-methyltransferase (Decarboxylating) subunit CbiE n=1 Tax=Nocardia panacis TaxID=2340916 RepID=A0A3A4K8B6_9NOCA|nr:precorrin-6y C5,15-methyltransferase (decarboxylating) subunit CbiE [Nocardia panacis]RJO68158.1 precorrin-6y C5,15-methyltransferase (decarboxylating) subunit CbiE [Nocardia panacis]
MTVPLAVVGIGADGWDGLGRAAMAVLASSEVLLGSARQLALVPANVVDAQRVAWPAPLLPALPGLLERYAGRQVAVLASGDPMFYGIGTTLARLLGPAALRVFPQPSSAALACARLGWGVAEIPVVSAVARPLSCVLPELTDGRRILVLSEDQSTPAKLAELLRRNGFGESTITVLEQLGGPAERIREGRAADWALPAGDPLNILAVRAVWDPKTPRATRTPGLPDELFGGEGQLTKSEVRALTIGALAPAPGELLWDVGGGSGSVAIEWCRTHPTCRAITFEVRADRRARIAENAVSLGVPQLTVRGAVPAAFADESSGPDAIFVGGGLTEPGLFAACWERLPAGGRLVAAAVTAESEAMLVELAARHGGDLRRFQVYRAESLGRFTTWRPQLPVTHWAVRKPGRS